MKDSSRGTDETGSRVSIFAPRSATGPPVGEARADALNAEQALAAMAQIQVRLQQARLVSRCLHLRPSTEDHAPQRGYCPVVSGALSEVGANSSPSGP